MLSLSKSVALIAVLLFAAVGCLAPLDFSHKRYREKYRLTEDDLKKIEFYVSTEVLVRADAGSPLVNDPEKSVIRLEREVDGRVVEAGPDWLRVSFSEKGTGVYFYSKTGESDDSYYLATRVAGKEGLTRMRDLADADRVLLHDGHPYRLILGGRAYLLAKDKDLEKVLDAKSVIIEGR